MHSVPVPTVVMRNVSKRFGAVWANAEVSFSVEQGSIHGIIGENGAGKTTAMNLLYGMLKPDAGEIVVRGKPCQWTSPADAIANGLGMVHQHFMLAGPFSALDNILVGAEPRRWGIIRRRAAQQELESLASQYGLAVDWGRPIEQLSVGAQQRIEILKLLYRKADLLIFDEPTAVLTPGERIGLFENLKKLCRQGKTVLLVSHKLQEILAVCDRVTVFRAGRVLAELATRETTPQELADLMVGRKVSLSIQVPAAKPESTLALEVADLNSGRHNQQQQLRDINLVVRHGEIVGVAGVEGNGQSELVRALLHPAEPGARDSGKLRVLGQDVSAWPSNRIRKLGVAVIPEDRREAGLLVHRPVSENFLLGLHRWDRFSRHGLIRREALKGAVERSLDVFDIRPREAGLPAGKLSGGNQQKLILAREFERDPRLIIASQPTRGVDVGAIEFIHRQLVRARDRGAGVFLISSDLDEILALSDRILVIYEGRLVGEFQRGLATERELGLKMGGA